MAYTPSCGRIKVVGFWEKVFKIQSYYSVVISNEERNLVWLNGLKRFLSAFEMTGLKVSAQHGSLYLARPAIELRRVVSQPAI